MPGEVVQGHESARDDRIYEARILFLWDLVKNFTCDLGISNRAFYSRVGSILKDSEELSGLRYGEKGLEAFPDFLRRYRSRRASARSIYVAAIYMSSLSRVLSKIFKEAERSLGEVKAREVFLRSFSALRKSHDETPDLTAYLPRGVAGEESELSVTTYPTILMDSLISYLVDDVISKNVESKNVEDRVPVRPAPLPVGSVDKEQVKKIYLDTLGPLGSKWFGRLGKLDEQSISDQVKQLREKSILDEKEAGEFMAKIFSLFEAEMGSK